MVLTTDKLLTKCIKLGCKHIVYRDSYLPYGFKAEIAYCWELKAFCYEIKSCKQRDSGNKLPSNMLEQWKDPSS